MSCNSLVILKHNKLIKIDELVCCYYLTISISKYRIGIHIWQQYNPATYYIILKCREYYIITNNKRKDVNVVQYAYQIEKTLFFGTIISSSAHLNMLTPYCKSCENVQNQFSRFLPFCYIFEVN